MCLPGKVHKQLSIQEILILLAVAMLQRSILKHRIRQSIALEVHRLAPQITGSIVETYSRVKHAMDKSLQAQAAYLCRAALPEYHCMG